MEEAGAQVDRPTRPARARNGARPNAVDVATDPFPGFATDLQAQFMALMTLADGECMIRETIFENRFMHVPGTRAAGRRHRVVRRRDAPRAGCERLQGAPVMATDLRASVSLVIAPWRPRARRWSTASITWIAASSGWRRSSRLRRRCAHRTARWPE